MKTFYNIYLFIALYFYRFLAWICGVFLRRRNASDGVLFLENFPIENAGYQYRVWKWKTEFEKNGLRCEVWTIFPDKNVFDIDLFLGDHLQKQVKRPVKILKLKIHHIITRV